MLRNNLLNDIDANNVYLYNLNLTLDNTTLDKFAGINYVLMQGSADRTKLLVQKLAKMLLKIDANYFAPVSLINSSKYVAYRVQNILVVSHGMGNTSLLTLLHNISKVLYASGNRDLEYIRIGTSGGIGVKAGSIILTQTAYMPNLISGYKVSALGKDIIYPSNMDDKLNNRILNSQAKLNNGNIFLGNSIAADDFYLSQARFDGAIKPKYTANDRIEYFNKLKQLNILNMEMESTGLAAFCNRAEIPATMVATTLLNRIESDQVTATVDDLAKYSDSSQEVVINYIMSCRKLSFVG